MAIGIYTLPICDGCKLPWLPVGWTQDSDPRNTVKPLRCGKCKSIGWDREFVKQQKVEVCGDSGSDGKSAEATETVQCEPAVGQREGQATPPTSKSRCKHRMTDCPICHPKEAA